MSVFSRSTIYALVILAVTTCVLMPGAGLASQDHERVVDELAVPFAPVRIVGLKTKKNGEVKFKKKFAEDDDWIGGLAILVQNTSGKTITTLAISATYRRPDESESSKPSTYTFVHTYHFGPDPFFPEYALRDTTKVIKPDETVELNEPAENYRAIKAALKQLKYPASVKRVELMIHTVGFEDGTIWSGGSWFYRDPDSPGKVIKGKPEQGRARNGSANFFTSDPRPATDS